MFQLQTSNLSLYILDRLPCGLFCKHSLSHPRPVKHFSNTAPVKMNTVQDIDEERARYQLLLDRTTSEYRGKKHEIRTTALFSLATKQIADFLHSTGHQSNLPQYGLLGFHIGERADIAKDEPILLNTNAPNSTFICGSQGSGKSYTLSCMLENCLMPDSQTGKLLHPVAGVVFHYNLDAASSVAEAAHLCTRGIKVRVLASKSNLWNAKLAYRNLQGTSGNLTVHPLQFRSRDLDVRKMNRLMAFSDKDGAVPLYMEVIQRILREMAIASKGQPFDYSLFLAKLQTERNFSGGQAGPMNLRLELLQSFMDYPPTSISKKSLLNLEPGTLTIVDLSDPFVDPSTACVLFDICLSLVKEQRPATGLVLAVDEAHKFMNESSAASQLTESLLTTIKEQRHNATRVIIATQEPTISEKLLDLCTVTIVHRFTSPAWFAAIQDHLSAASGYAHSSEQRKGMFEEIVNLGTGESLVFSASSYLCVEEGMAKKLGSRVVRMKTRRRVGVDGGASKMADGGDRELDADDGWNRVETSAANGRKTITGEKSGESNLYDVLGGVADLLID